MEQLQPFTDLKSGVAYKAASAILSAFQAYQAEFKSITRRARLRFERRDWHGAQADAVERLDLYKNIIDTVVLQVSELLGGQARSRSLWARMKSEYSPMLASQQDFELAETFFNSVTRRIFHTVGVDPQIEFVASDFEPRGVTTNTPIYHSYDQPCQEPAQAACLVQAILADFSFDAAYNEPSIDTACAGIEIAAQLQAHFTAAYITHAEVLKSAFYRGNRAYLVGRIFQDEHVLPLILCLAHPEQGLQVDAVLLDEDEASILFSFTRSYFHVETEQPGEMVRFLKSILPLKRPAELYIAIGYNKHGKTELYRDLIHHLSITGDRFEIARGERGMVMTVFSMPNFDMVFKIIRDQADAPKSTSRREVMEHYDLVFRHDRAGRLVDAQEFEFLRFEKNRFTSELLHELLTTAPSLVSIEGDTVSIRHLYIERRLTPLNLFIKENPPDQVRQAIIDYGQAIKDLAATNIFPGDVLLKNFGVTRHGRVVFYDYDELCPLIDLKFRILPQASFHDDEFSADPWFYVGTSDIFPEEFRTFLGLPSPWRELFTSQHGDLFGVEFWRDMQARHRRGELVEILPYPAERRLRCGG